MPWSGSYDYRFAEFALRDLPEMWHDALLLEEIAVNAAAFPSGGESVCVQSGVRSFQQDRFVSNRTAEFSGRIKKAVNTVLDEMEFLPAGYAEVICEVCFKRTAQLDTADIFNIPDRKVRRIKSRSFAALKDVIRRVSPVIFEWRSWREKQAEELGDKFGKGMRR